jgi:hypothetical protein
MRQASSSLKDVHLLTSPEKGETITVTACCNTEGRYLPLKRILKSVNKKRDFEDGVPLGSAVTVSMKSAFVTSEVFMIWLKHRFHPRKPRGYVLTILDVHSSHDSDIGTAELANGNDIVLLCLPSHSSPFLQQVYRSFF